MKTIEFKANLSCEAYFYFGIESFHDCLAVENVLRNFCKRFFNVWPTKSLSEDIIFCSILEILENYAFKNACQDDLAAQKKLFYSLSNRLKRKKKNDTTKAIVIDKSEEKLNHYKTVLDHYNCLIRDEILESIRKSKDNDSYLFSLLSVWDEFKAVDKNLLFKNDSVVFLFCLTKNYLNSELFKLDWKEAKESGEEILLILLEKDLNIKHLNHNPLKILQIVDNWKIESGKFEILELNPMFMDLYYSLRTILNRNLIEIVPSLRTQYEKNISICYRLKDKKQVEIFLNELEEYDWKIQPKITKESTSSYITIFFLANSNVHEFKKALGEKKILIPILMDDLNESIIEEFKLTRFIDFKLIFILIESQINSLYQDENNDIYCNFKVSNVVKEHHKFVLPTQFEISGNLLIFRSTLVSNQLKIYNIKTNEKVCEKTERDGLLFCWIDHLQYFIIIEINSELYTNWPKVYNIYGNFVKKLSDMSRAKAVSYNSINRKTYVLYSIEDRVYGLFFCSVEIYDEMLNFERRHVSKNVYTRNCIKCLNDGNIYIWLKLSNQVDIYDKEMNFVFKLITISIIDSIFSHPKYSNFILVSSLDSIQIINTNSFQSCGLLELPGIVKFITNDKIIMHDGDDNTFWGTFEIKSSILETIYTCNMNPFKPHLYENPYLLPCGASGCYFCIYKNYNLIKNSMKCNLCSVQHKLFEIKKNFELSEKLSKDSKLIVKKMIEISFSHMSSLDTRFNDYENCFSYIEGEIEIKIESLKMEIENQKASFTKNMEKLEKKLLAGLLSVESKKNNSKSKFIQIKNFSLLKHSIFVGKISNSKPSYFELNKNVDELNEDELFVRFSKNFIE